MTSASSRIGGPTAESAARPRPPAARAMPELAGSAPTSMLMLQRAVGNRAVAGLIGRRTLPGGAGTRPLPTAAVPAVTSSERAGEAIPASVAATVGGLGADLLRAALGPPPTAKPTAPLADLGSGEAIPGAVRSPFEASFGYDLSPVRIHRGSAAQRAAASVRAGAFSLGDHIVLGGDIDLTGPAGRHVLGHEFAHTIQSRIGGAGSGRVSSPDWPTEREAERAASAAASGRSHEIGEKAGDDLHRIAPWLILAGIGLAAGLVIWAASDSPEENRERHAAGAPNPAEEVWALIPVYGSIQQIREADSYFQRVLGVGFLMLDCATLGTAGIAGKALIKAPGALIRTAIAKRGAALVVREGGEIASEAMAKETAAAFTREGGALLASQAQAGTEMLSALQRGSLVVVTEGGLNHAAIYARNAAGQVMKVHGGPLRLLFGTGGREMAASTGQSIAKRANAYLIIEGGEAAVGIEEAVAQVSRSGPAALRWLGGNPTSCGIMQGALLEASGLSEAALGRLLPAGGAAGRMLPITILDQMAASGGLRFVEGGMSRIIGGTLMQGSLLGVGAGIGPIASSAMRFLVNAALPEDGAADGAQAESADERAQKATGRTRESDDAAIAIVGRFGRAPAGPARTIQNALPDIVPGWFVRSIAFHDSVVASLVHIGMSPDLAREIVGG